VYCRLSHSRFTVRPGATVRHTVELRAGRRWYDLAVVVASHSGSSFLWCFAGDAENGRPGVSDQALAGRTSICADTSLRAA
jgi:phospholipase C